MCTISIGKRSWLIQAAILYEAQRRSTYGEHSLEAIARRFEIGLRQAQKYALVWKVFFEQEDAREENVNIDAILLDEPSRYVVATTETKEPESWLAYAQDPKMEYPRYSVASFRKDILVATLTQGVAEVEEAVRPETALPTLDNKTCPWIKPLCTRSGKPIQINDCADCEFNIPSPVKPDPVTMENQ